MRARTKALTQAHHMPLCQASKGALQFQSIATAMSSLIIEDSLLKILFARIHPNLANLSGGLDIS